MAGGGGMSARDATTIGDFLRCIRDDCGHQDAPDTRAEAEAALAALDRLEARRECVWTVSRGEACEGSDVLRVCASKEGAMAAVREFMGAAHFDGGWTLEHDAVHTMYWRNGCDLLSIECFEVSP